MDNMNPREVALDILVDIDKNNHYSNKIINQVLKKYQFSSKQDRAFITRICEGVVEYKLQLDYIVDQYSNTPIAKCKPVIRNILRMGVYQIKYMNGIPDTAACNEAVKLAKKRKFVNLSGFVNGVLRNIARGIDNINYPDERLNPNKYLSVYYSTPEWLVDKLVTDYDYATTKCILESTTVDRGTTIRCCNYNVDYDELREKLKSNNIVVHHGKYIKDAMIINNYDYVRRIPGFQDGDFVVQDESSMLVGYIADNREKDVVLDICAAPGGKSLHIADLTNDKAHIVARDVSLKKISLIDDNIERCGYDSIEAEVWDALELDETMIGKADVVIADLPCSGLGIMGKKNDIKYRVTKEQLEELVKLQRSILMIANNYVKPGGTLVYSTCTINIDENINNARWFAGNFPFEFSDISSYVPDAFNCNTSKDGYIAILPGVCECDGFFIAKFKKEK